MQNVGAAWLMTSLTTSPLLVALVQTATNLPVFLLGVPAGAFADLFDRRKLLIVTQGWMLAAAALLSALTFAHATGPWMLLFLGLVVAAKVLVVWGLAKLGGLTGRKLQLAVGLGQVGEFSYVLGALALSAGLISRQVSAGLIGAVVVSIAASSVLVRIKPRAGKVGMEREMTR